MITGVEINMIVTDSLSALALYERIFEVERIEVTAFEKGSNEAVFSIYGTRIHMLDENPEYMMLAPKPDGPKPMWLNVAVPDIHSTFKAAMDAGCSEITPVTEMPEMGVINAMFADPFGYIWLLHEIKEIVSFEDRMKFLEGQMEK